LDMEVSIAEGGGMSRVCRLLDGVSTENGKRKTHRPPGVEMLGWKPLGAPSRDP